MAKRKRGATPSDRGMKRVIAARSELKSMEKACGRASKTQILTRNHVVPLDAPSAEPATEGGGFAVGASPFTPPAAANAANPSVAIARLLSDVAEGLGGNHSRDDIADFLLRCAFTMFLSSVDIIPARALTCAVLSDTLALAWAAMGKVLALPRTGIFATTTVPALDGAAKQALVEADACDWTGIDLSIFGALVEGAFDPKQRHRLGAHYTPRSYVMQLVGPTIEEPLRREWELVRADNDAQKVLGFHKKLCATRVLDPASGAGNFLIVALETIYGIEDDVLRELDSRGVERPTECVAPHQMHGIEINPRACEVCKLVLNMCHLRRRHAHA